MVRRYINQKLVRGRRGIPGSRRQLAHRIVAGRGVEVGEVGDAAAVREGAGHEAVVASEALVVHVLIRLRGENGLSRAGPSGSI